MKKILIVDYITGGGFAEEDLPLDRLAEGYAILRTSIEQFAQLGYKITTLIDQRLMQHIRISPIHDFKSVSTHEEFLTGIRSFADQVDYTLTLAPETKGILKDLASIFKGSRSVYLGSKPESIELAADKLNTMNLAKELGMNVPATFSPNCNDPLEKIAEEDNVVFLGRGSQFILQDNPNVLHVLVVADLEDRIKFIENIWNKSRREAEKAIQTREKRRDAFLKYFNKGHPNSLGLYHLIINTSKMEIDEAEDLIVWLANNFEARAKK